MKQLLVHIFLLLISTQLNAQSPQWTEQDRSYLLQNLIRSRDELINETKGLTKEQWSFKESPDRWSINQVVEHIAIWEMLMDYDITRALQAGIDTSFASDHTLDTTNLRFIMEDKPHVSTDYTKPFTYTVPMGLNEGTSNTAWLLKLRNESIDYVKTTKDDLRSYGLPKRRGNIHQRYITLFGHCDRHLRQIRKIKADSRFPR